MEVSELVEINLIKQVYNIFNFVDFKKHKLNKEIKKILTYNLVVFDHDNELRILEDPNAYFDIMSLCISGFIKLENELFDFTNFIKEILDEKKKNIFLISLSIILTLEFIEFNNLFKAIRNVISNAKFIYENVSKIIDENNEEKFLVDRKIFHLLARRSTFFYSIILGSGVLLK